jgi:hypothetical protein
MKGTIINIIIIGSGSLGREIVSLIEEIITNYPRYKILGFLGELTQFGFDREGEGLIWIRSAVSIAGGY